MKKDFHTHLSLGLFCEPMIVILLQKQKISFLAIRSGSSLISNWIIWKYVKISWNFQNTGLKKSFFLSFFWNFTCLLYSSMFGKILLSQIYRETRNLLAFAEENFLFLILCLLYLPKFKIFPKFKGKQEIFQIQKFFIDSSH